MDHLYRCVADEIVERIERGLYRPGDRLPSVRLLSTQRGISAATAVAAYRRLEDERYIEVRPRSGFYVRSRTAVRTLEPAAAAVAAPPCAVTGQEMAMALIKAANDPAVVQLGAAVPDPAFLPNRALAAALASVARRHAARSARYEMPPGAPELRRQIARCMAEAGCPVSPDELVITGGCQEALTLALRAVTAPGDVVAIESPAFYGLLQVLDSLGLEALEIPTHTRQGLSLEALELALDRWPVKACVVVPNYSNPLGCCMAEARKRALATLLAGRGIPLIEDDVYGDLGFHAHRPSTCKGLMPAADVLYCNSFSKTLSPGLRIGWIAPGRHRDRVEYLKYVSSIAAPTAPQLALAEFLENGRYERHLRQVRGEYARAVARMSEAVTRLFPAGTRISQPEGGFVLWVELPGEVDSFDLARRALEAGVSIAPGPIFSATQKYRNYLRLSCARVWDDRLERALGLLARMVG